MAELTLTQKLDALAEWHEVMSAKDSEREAFHLNAAQLIRLQIRESEDGELARGALHAIHEFLDHNGVPRGTFADDHVKNLGFMYAQRGRDAARIIESLNSVLDRARRDFAEIMDLSTRLGRQGLHIGDPDDLQPMDEQQEALDFLAVIQRQESKGDESESV